jgi:hypothetical protein
MAERKKTQARKSAPRKGARKATQDAGRSARRVAREIYRAPKTTSWDNGSLLSQGRLRGLGGDRTP